MSQPAIVVEWGVPVMDASAVMETNDVRRVPVVDDEDIVIGIISLGDVREAASVYSTTSPYAPDQDEILLEVDEVMTSPVLTVTPYDTVLHVVKLMLERKIGGVPVVDEEGHPLGMVTESDIFRLLVQDWEQAQEAGVVESDS